MKYSFTNNKKDIDDTRTFCTSKQTLAILHFHSILCMSSLWRDLFNLVLFCAFVVGSAWEWRELVNITSSVCICGDSNVWNWRLKIGRRRKNFISFLVAQLVSRVVGPFRAGNFTFIWHNLHKALIYVVQLWRNYTKRKF